VKEFLKKYGIDTESINVDTILNDFSSEMDAGLSGEDSSLKMIPAFISSENSLPAEEPVIVIDAGGTNLRIAVIEFNLSGKPSINYLEKYPMPGIDKELSADEFYAKFAEYLRPVLDRSDKIGFCFSYPAEISPARDGKLIHWTKDIKVPEVVGTFIGKGLLDYLGDAGEGKSIVLLNDTIATLLAGKAAGTGSKYSSYVGFILGTGTNTAYVEQNCNIKKRNDLAADGSMTINIESGNFSLIPQGRIEMELDAASQNPGSQMLEKMISGLYRGKLILTVLKYAATEKLFSAECSEYINSIDELSAYDVDMFLLSKEDGPLMNKVVSGADAEAVRELINAVYRRCAKLTALNISAAVLKSGAGKDAAAPVCVNIDGSTYYKSVGFKDMTESYMQEILGSRGVAYELIHVDEAPMLGAAVAGLVQ
jgi:hexokinase